ncbi:MAG TPA: nitrous oxide reductase family maturation protein NosD [Bacteroidia bacterium]|nr:nitrous oxide reductase family maturation protein NosD [Bacteroidia bacterium]HNT80815.1 nitrous oxide reductase family maturation protein NosD [Bacteroidia bacterium]
MIRVIVYIITICLGLLSNGVFATVTVKNAVSFSTALQNSNDGDSIILKKGVYQLSNINITKSISIIGEDGTIIDGGGDAIFVLSAPNILIESISFRNVGVSYIQELSAIRILKTKNCCISNNKFVNCFFAIYVERSDSCTITNNTIHGESSTEASSGNAIHLWYSNYAIIKNNYTRSHRDGVYLEFVTHSIIENNISEKNLRYGLHFMFSHDNVYRYNEFRNNSAGVAVMYSENVTMIANKFIDNWGSNCYGLLLKDIRRSTLTQNEFIRNTVGIHLDNALDLQIDSNQFTDNGWAVRIMSNSYDNQISYNNFIDNTFEFTTTGKHNINQVDNNYWSSYSGYDINKDGIGDIPHRPVSLFSYIISTSQASIILLRSLFIELLNFAERVVPVFTPETLSDKSPLIKPV